MRFGVGSGWVPGGLRGLPVDSAWALLALPSGVPLGSRWVPSGLCVMVRAHFLFTVGGASFRQSKTRKWSKKHEVSKKHRIASVPGGVMTCHEQPPGQPASYSARWRRLRPKVAQLGKNPARQRPSTSRKVLWPVTHTCSLDFGVNSEWVHCKPPYPPKRTQCARNKIEWRALRLSFT